MPLVYALNSMAKVRDSCVLSPFRNCHREIGFLMELKTAHAMAQRGFCGLLTCRGCHCAPPTRKCCSRDLRLHCAHQGAAAGLPPRASAPPPRALP